MIPAETDQQCLPKWTTVRDAIGDLDDPVGTEIRNVEAPYNLHFGRSPTELSKKRYRLVPPGGNRFDLQSNAPELTPKCWIKKTSGGTDLFGSAMVGSAIGNYPSGIFQTGEGSISSSGKTSLNHASGSRKANGLSRSVRILWFENRNCSSDRQRCNRRDWQPR